MELSKTPNAIENGGNNEARDESKNKIRTILPQIFATTVTIFLLLDVGASISFPTILIAALTGRNNHTNPNESLQMTAIQASWLSAFTQLSETAIYCYFTKWNGSSSYLIKLIGSLICGIISDTYGRKKAMIFINIPALLSWYFFYYSTSIERVFIANGLLSITSGFVKATCVTYVGEVSESSHRGVLVATGSFSTTIGPLIIYLLGTVIEWRSVALIFCAIQLATLVALFLVPESPIWLMTKNRDEEALSALKWLRGWHINESIQNEFNDLKRYKEYANACPVCRKAKVRCTHPPTTVIQNFNALLQRKTIKPFVILATCLFFAFSCGTHHLLSFTVQILNAFQSPIDANWATVVVGILAVCGTCSSIILIRLIGKRRLFLISMAGVFSSMFALAAYGFLYLPPNAKSYEHKSTYDHSHEVSVVPLILFCLCRYFSIGATLVPLTMLGELFPLRIRSMATGFTTAVGNIETFIAIKTFYDYERWTSLPGTFCIYAILGALGLIITYFILPETEDRTLEDIELHFSDNQRSLFDRNITRRKQDIDENQNTAQNNEQPK